MLINKRAGSIVLLASLGVTDAFTPTPSLVQCSRRPSSHRQQLPLREVVTLKAVNKEFVNDGAFSFMEPFLSVLGFKEGRTTNYGPTIPVNESEFPSEEEQQQRREKAKSEMTNIGTDERERRTNVGDISYKVAAGYAVFSSLFLDDGTIHGSLSRFAIILPLFFAVGFKTSGEKGLWNVAQAGKWDIDGTGIRNIDDDDLAKAFLVKVNEMNVETGLEALLLAASFAALPSDFTGRVAGVTVVVASLYFLQGKIPKE